MVALAQTPITPYVIPNKDWVQYYSQMDLSHNVPSAIDANNNMFTAGYTGIIPSAQAVVMKRDSTGALIYAIPFGTTGFNICRAIKIDAAGNAYVCGTFEDASTGLNYFAAKISASGSVLWNQDYDLGGASLIDESYALVLDLNGDVYITGKSQEPSNGDFDIITLKLDGSNGNIIWPHTFSGAASLDDDGVGLTLSSDGLHLYILGNSTDATNGRDAILYALDSGSGTYDWSPITFNGAANGNDKAKAITLAGANVVICGEQDNTVSGLASSGLDAFVAKIDGFTSAVLWNKSYDFNYNDNNATALAKDSAGNIGVTGVAYDAITNHYEYHTLLFDSLGNQYATNKENTHSSTYPLEPSIACDSIAHHWYISGEKTRTTKDVFVYQVAPSGNTAWRMEIDGQTNDEDAATGIAVNGVGVAYVSAVSKNSSSFFDFMCIKINQTPAYFPPDITSNEPASDSHLFYENKGQIIYDGVHSAVEDVLFSTENFFYPHTFFSANRISYKLFTQKDTIHTGDTVSQRIDIGMVETNSFANAHPFLPKQGTLSYMTNDYPAPISGIQGYERYMIPNIYPYIDLHYYSNEKGLKIYYVVKPFGNPSQIMWQISGANSHTINSNQLEINGFNHQIKFSEPKVYTVNNLGQAAALSSTVTPTWQFSGGIYTFGVPPYNPALPLIIELDYGAATSTSPTDVEDNRSLCTYYGGSTDDGFLDVDVDKNSGDFVTLGLTKVPQSPVDIHFPIIAGLDVSSSTYTNNSSPMMTTVLFDKDGFRKATNTYQAAGLNPGKICLLGNKITIIGNTSTQGFTLPLHNSPGSLASNCYSTNVNGFGFVLQFEFTTSGLGTTGTINKINWSGRLNGVACDIDKTPDGNFIYITSATNNQTTDTKVKTGAYNNHHMQSVFTMPLNSNFQISKFDPNGVRDWSCIIPVLNDSPIQYSNQTKFGNLAGVIANNHYVRCNIACDNYGFYLAGETDRQIAGGFWYSKYGKPIYNYNPNSFKDAFFARFNKKDSVVYASSFGGYNGNEAFNDITILGPNEVVAVGYSNSTDGYSAHLTKAGGGAAYLDTTMTGGAPNITGTSKLLINKFDSTGAKTWGTFYGNNNIGDCVSWGVSAGNNGNFYITGKDSGSFVFPVSNPTGLYSQTANSKTESFMLAFDGTNQLLWNTRFGGLKDELGLATKYNPVTLSIIKVGITNTPFNPAAPSTTNFPIFRDLNSYPQSWWQNNLNPGNPFFYDGYFAIFKTNLVVGIKEYFTDNFNQESFNLFPNPAQNECTLAFKQELQGAVKINVHNQMGQLIASEYRNFISEKTLLNINTQYLAAGVYIITVSDKQNTMSKKLIIER